MGMTASVKRMLEMKSIDVEARRGGEEDGWTCLMTAALHGHLDICRLLIDKGAQVNAKDSRGYTPLHGAAFQGHIKIVCLLCDRGADIEARNQDGSRPLHYAVKYGHFPIMKELIEVRNAGINARDDDGWTALREARHSNKAYIVSYLFSHGGIE
jgi:ankyrin repeat protein